MSRKLPDLQFKGHIWVESGLNFRLEAISGTKVAGFTA